MVVADGYVGYVAWKGDWDPGLVVMLVLTVLWGHPVDGKFCVEGGRTSGSFGKEKKTPMEYIEGQKRVSTGVEVSLFNLFFISVYQNGLILLFTLPAVIAFDQRGKDMYGLDYLAAGLMFLFIVYEMVADWQQWQYQSGKWKAIKSGAQLTADQQRGFLNKGLWALSRHPNYFAEQSIWISFYLFSVAASGQWINWSLTGALLLVLLFQGSADFSEEISAGKYPDYKTYQKTVSKFIPLPQRKAKEMQEIKSICVNLWPKTLKKPGLLEAGLWFQCSI
ncbi:MAG: DUF1295 domain-containing protein [Saprospiraceae bacterium]|nr:DUF1295 domain-containing protein [Saprospiraceae bacterium]